MPANMEGAADPLMDDAAVYLVTASGDTKCKNIPTASAATISLTTEAAATHIKSAASSATVMEVSPRQAEYTNKSGSQSTNSRRSRGPGGTPTDRSTKINAVASPEMDGGGVIVTRTKKKSEQPGRHLMMDPWRRCRDQWAQVQ
jgi:hypothetical protein